MTINLEFAKNKTASATSGGVLTSGAQTIAGVKTFQDNIYVGATADTTGLSPHMFGSTILTSNF